MNRFQSAGALVLVTFFASPAAAQFGGLGKVLDKAQKIDDKRKQLDDELNVSDEEEQKIGADVSARIRERFGVVQDAALTKYVSLVGTVLAQSTDRPALPWTFVVLDTDGVNAFASPGGYVHITRGALGLIRSEAQLAGVLGHEIGHVVHKHAVNAIKKSKAVQLGTNQLKDRAVLLNRVADAAYKVVLENAFDRGDELDADGVGVQLASKAGYAPGALAEFLAHLDDRNRNQPERNGLFASHPETKERIDKVHQLAGAKSGAIVEARYKTNVKYEPTEITRVAAGGEAGSDEQKKKGFGLAALSKSSSTERQSTQVSASGGARGVGPDRAAKGGDNPQLVKVTVTAAEVAAFRKGIV